MKKAVAICLNFKARLKMKSVLKQTDNGSVVTRPRDTTLTDKLTSVETLRQAETEIIRIVQSRAFNEEIEILQPCKNDFSRESTKLHKKLLKGTSPLFKLDPFVDEDGVIRVGGRVRRGEFDFDTSHPVILPGKSHITELLIQHCHEKG